MRELFPLQIDWCGCLGRSMPCCPESFWILSVGGFSETRGSPPPNGVPSPAANSETALSNFPLHFYRVTKSRYRGGRRDQPTLVLPPAAHFPSSPGVGIQIKTPTPPRIRNMNHEVWIGVFTTKKYDNNNDRCYESCGANEVSEVWRLSYGFNFNVFFTMGRGPWCEY